MEEMKKEKILIEYSWDGATAIAADANYDFNTAMYELIDNSFAEEADHVTVILIVNEANQLISIAIEDDGKGLSKEDIGTAFAPGTKKGESINEHGVGMKAAIVHFGKLDEFYSRLGKKGSWLMSELDPDSNGGAVNIEVDKKPSKGTGCTLQITCDLEKTMYTKNPSTNTVIADAKKWGYRYADILDSAKKLTMVYQDPKGKELRKEEVESWKPEHAKQLLNRVTIEGKKTGFKAKLDIYELKDDSNHLDPVKKATAAGGIDIVIHGRCIVSRSKSLLSKCLSEKGEPRNFDHPDYNKLYGRLIVEEGIKTTPKKDNIQENDPAFVELTEMIAQVWDEQEINKNFKSIGVKDASETDIENNLMALLKEQCYTEVENQKTLKFNQRIDVSAKTSSGERKLWEVKKDKAVVSDVLQLVNYLKIEKLTKGVLVARGFNSNCREYIDETWGDLEIEFWDLTSVTYRGLLEKSR